ncbi:MAG: M56 family metallopeptidase [Lachnospiraceae bacterium]|nr:M56 family metallopeptidase [Lachnospiraceae bacterium]
MAAFMFHIIKINLIAAVIILLAVCSARMTKQKYSLKWKYYMWLAVSVFLLIPVNLSARSPIRLQINRPGVYRSGVQQIDGPGVDQSGVLQIDSLTGNTGSESGAGQKNAAGNATEKEAGEENRGEDRREAEESAAQNPGYISIQIPSEKVSVYGVLEIFGVVWAAGIFFSVIAKVLRYYFSLHQMTRWSYPVEDKRVLELYRWICLKKHIRRPPRLLISPELSTPVLAGLRHTGLYLTEEDYDMEELKFILSHELTHYRRGDLWYKMLLLAVNTIYWFNPALYWMRSEAERDIENLCDGSVVAAYTKEEQMKYSRLLLKTAALQNHVPYLAASLNDSTLIFKERILYMRNLQHLKKNVGSVVVLTAMMLTVQLMVGSVINETETGRGICSAGSVEKILAGEDESGAGSDGGIVPASGGLESVVAGFPGYTGAKSQSSVPAGEGEVAGERPDQQGTQAFYGDRANAAGADRSAPESLAADGTAEDHFRENSLTGDTSADNPSADTASQGAPATPVQGYTLTDQQITLYSVGGEGANYVNKASDGNWYDGSGRQYAQNGGDQWICLTNGTAWTDSTPDTPADRGISQSSVIDAEGYNQMTLYQQADGSWQNIAGGIYMSNGDGTWTGPDGTIWYGN